MVRRLTATSVAQGTLTAATNAIVFPQTLNRSYLEIVNTHASLAIDLNFGVPAVVGQGLRIPFGARVRFTADDFVHLGSVNIISSGAATYQAIQC